MVTSKTTEPSIHMIQKEIRKAETLSIHYCMYRVTTGETVYYAIEICLNDENSMQILGTNEKRALRVYEMLVNECVTPCTLVDILHDIGCEENSRLHLQNLCKL